MKASRLLPLINAVGCVLITGLLVFQWLREHDLRARVKVLVGEVATARENYEMERVRAASLENDISQLKAAVEATHQAKQDADAAVARLTAEQEARTATTADAVASQRELLAQQTARWEKALAERDAKIRELNASSLATRARLDEAISKLKQAGAR